MISRTLAPIVAAMLLLLALEPAAAQTPHRHAMSEYAFLVGTWHCVAHVGEKRVGYDTTFRWMYPSHKAIVQHIETPRSQADFMLAYTAKTDSFHGVFTGSTGDLGFWKNPGPHGDGWTEYGYDVTDPSTPNTRAVFYGVTPTHYAFHFYAIKSQSDPGTPIESDECNKVASSAH